MESKEDWVTLEELIKMCEALPANISLARKSASKPAAEQFNLMTDAAVKEFIANDGLENPIFYKHSYSNQISGTKITEYKFKSGTKNGYLAFHLAVGKTNSIHIKSFHEDAHNPSLGTFKDILTAAISGEKK